METYFIFSSHLDDPIYQIIYGSIINWRLTPPKRNSTWKIQTKSEMKDQNSDRHLNFDKEKEEMDQLSKFSRTCKIMEKK